jgi:hypothetical protein
MKKIGVSVSSVKIDYTSVPSSVFVSASAPTSSSTRVGVWTEGVGVGFFIGLGGGLGPTFFPLAEGAGEDELGSGVRLASDGRHDLGSVWSGSSFAGSGSP